MARPRRVDAERSNQERTPIGQRGKLTVPEHLKERGYQYRFFNDDEGRIESAIDAGWAIVEAKAQVGDPNVGQATQFGSAISKPVGGGKRAILMRIREDWFKEDQSAKEARIKENTKALLLDQNGNAPDPNTVYGEGIRLKQEREMPVIQDE